MSESIISNQALESKDFYVFFGGDVTPENIDKILQLIVDKVTKEDKNHLILILSTNGGSIKESIVFYNTVKTLPINITTYNMERVASSGNMLYLSGNNRFAYPSSSFLYHDPVTNFIGVPYATCEGLEQLKNKLKETKDRMINIVSETLGIDINRAATFYKGHNVFYAKDAKDIGIAKDIKTLVKLDKSMDFTKIKSETSFGPYETPYL